MAVPLSEAHVKCLEFAAAKEQDVRGLLERRSYKLVPRDGVPPTSRLLKDTDVLVIRNAETDKGLYKARYVIQGFRDPVKEAAIRNPITI